MDLGTVALGSWRENFAAFATHWSMVHGHKNGAMGTNEGKIGNNIVDFCLYYNPFPPCTI